MSEKEERIKVSAKLPKSLVDFVDIKKDEFNPKLNRQQMIEFIIRKYKDQIEEK